jgi:hypothetical protein
VATPRSTAARRAARFAAVASLALWGCDARGPGDEATAIVNECATASFVDGVRGGGVVRIAFGDELGHNYEPPCVRVVVGDVVRFEGPFDTHPLVPGRIVDGMPSDVDTAGRTNPVPEVLGDELGRDVSATTATCTSPKA